MNSQSDRMSLSPSYFLPVDIVRILCGCILLFLFNFCPDNLFRVSSLVFLVWSLIWLFLNHLLPTKRFMATHQHSLGLFPQFFDLLMLSIAVFYTGLYSSFLIPMYLSYIGIHSLTPRSFNSWSALCISLFSFFTLGLLAFADVLPYRNIFAPEAVFHEWPFFIALFALIFTGFVLRSLVHGLYIRNQNLFTNLDMMLESERDLCQQISSELREPVAAMSKLLLHGSVNRERETLAEVRRQTSKLVSVLHEIDKKAEELQDEHL